MTALCFKHVRVLGLVVSASLLAVACGESEVVSARYEGTEGPLARVDNGDPTNPSDPTQLQYRLRVVGDLEMTSPGSRSQTVAFELLDATTNMTVSDQTINFRVEGGAEGTSLSARQGFTDATGRAAVDVRLSNADQMVTLWAENASATPVKVTIDVTKVDAGQLSVEFLKPTFEEVQIETYRIRTYAESDLRCDAYFPRSPSSSFDRESVTNDARQAVLFEDVVAGNYTVVVEGLGAAQRSVAVGCNDSVQVQTDRTTSTVVVLDMLPIEPAGRYDVTSTWDFSDAIADSGDVGNTLVTLIEFMSNPGGAIFDLAMDELDDLVGFSLSTFVSLSGFDDDVADYINERIFRDAGLSEFRAIASDLNTILNELNVVSELNVEKTAVDGTFLATETWKQVTLNWSLPCDGSDPNCGQYVLDADSNGQIAGLGFMSYQWEGTVEGYDQFTVESYRAQLQMGALLLHIIEKVVIPQVTGGSADTLAGAFSYWIDCADLARDLVGNQLCVTVPLLGTQLCLGRQTAEMACELAIEELTEQVVDPVVNQSIVMDVLLSGNATLVDTSSDGYANEMKDGVTTGEIDGSDQPILVEWTAELSAQQ